MRFEFVKYQGTGNDFVVLDARAGALPEGLAAAAPRVCERHFGIGADGLAIVLPPSGPGAAARMRIVNADGSVPEMCGNALRCVSRHLLETGAVAVGVPFLVETDAGARSATVLADGHVRTALGVPDLRPEAVGLPALTPEGPVRLEAAGRPFTFQPVSMGNPHAVVRLDTLEGLPLEVWGPALGAHPAFSAGANVEFYAVLSPERARMRVWERGAGATLACGTGACATLAAGVRAGVLARAAVLELPGGELRLEWPSDDAPVWLTGPAERVFSGIWER